MLFKSNLATRICRVAKNKDQNLKLRVKLKRRKSNGSWVLSSRASGKQKPGNSAGKPMVTSLSIDTWGKVVLVDGSETVAISEFIFIRTNAAEILSTMLTRFCVGRSHSHPRCCFSCHFCYHRSQRFFIPIRRIQPSTQSSLRSSGCVSVITNAMA